VSADHPSEEGWFVQAGGSGELTFLRLSAEVFLCSVQSPYGDVGLRAYLSWVHGGFAWLIIDGSSMFATPGSLQAGGPIDGGDRARCRTDSGAYPYSDMRRSGQNDLAHYLGLADHRVAANPAPDHVRFSGDDLHAVLKRRTPWGANVISQMPGAPLTR
jgi:hypothetical protein